ncbi:transposase [Moraxella lincolnii]|uniref:transposase n=1 Tax=Lwoffella lincolnii TaxID=90241 RepID=UPI00117CDF95|nr:transposase [Moraxella lincolnii]
MTSHHCRCHRNPNRTSKKQYDNGKKKQHTLKAQIIVHWQTGMILDVQTYKGSVHDFKPHKDTYPEWFEYNTLIMVDNGYQGIGKRYKQTFILS